MNIYITPSNEEKLRNEKSMSGLINRLLSDYYATQPVSYKEPTVDTTVTEPEDEEDPESWYGVSLKDLVYDQTWKVVMNLNTEEPVEPKADKKLIAKLIARRQVG